MQIILLIAIVYILLVFFDIRLVVPYFGFYKDRLSKDIPQEWEEKIEEINKTAKTNADFLHLSYNYITSKYKGSRLETFTKCLYAFENIFQRKNGYLPCTIQNELLRMMLIRSGRFTDKDILLKATVVNLFVHQYMMVKVDEEWVYVDPWAKSFGVPFGKYAFLFV